MSKRGKLLKQVKEDFEGITNALQAVLKLPKEDKLWFARKLENWEGQTHLIETMEKINNDAALAIADDEDDLPF